MRLTEQEFKTIAAYDSQLQIAVRSKYLRNIGRTGLAVLVPIYERVTGTKKYVQVTCGACVLDFLQRLGAIYFADKEEREAAATTEQTPAKPKRSKRAK